METATDHPAGTVSMDPRIRAPQVQLSLSILTETDWGAPEYRKCRRSVVYPQEIPPPA